MTSPLVVLGDDIAVLGGLAPVPHALADDLAPRVRGMVWGVDLAGMTPRLARARLKKAATDALLATEHHTGASHLILVFAHDARHRDEAYWSAAEAIASRLRARIERARGREWDVVVIDASRCDDAGLLHVRLRDAVAGRAGAVGSAALEWHDVRDQPIHRAAARHSL